jgi:iron complex transport system ATP-binding protein
MIKVANVTVERDGRRLLADVSAFFEAGRKTAILGPNGAGKSTLVKVVSGEWRPERGHVAYGDRDIARLPAGQLAGCRAVVPQNTALAFPFDVLDVVMLGSTVPGFGVRADTAPAHAALAAVGLAEFTGRTYTRLSGGEKQRVHIARALCQLTAAPPGGPRFLILDEPTSSLDPAHQALVLAALRQQADLGWTIVVVLHDLNLAAAWVDRAILMSEGRVQASGTPATIFCDALLSDTYRCRLVPNRPPPSGEPYVLPHHTRPAAICESPMDADPVTGR